MINDGFKIKEKIKNCANCGQLIAKDGGYKGFLHTYRAFCCKDCYKAYKNISANKSRNYQKLMYIISCVLKVMVTLNHRI